MKKARLTSSLLMIFSSFGSAFVTPNIQLAQAQSYSAVSYIDTTTNPNHDIMVVDGKPFLYIGTQYSPHRLIPNYGWTWSDMDQIFKQAVADGFTVIACPVKWNQIEPTENNFDWSSWLDPQIDLAAKYGVHMEILWFGSETSTKSSEGAPNYVMNNYQAVLKSDGTPEINNGDNSIKLDYSDPNLLSREEYVLQTMMNHVRDYITQKGYYDVVAGVEVQNEPTVVTIANDTAPTDRSYSSYANNLWNSGHYTSATQFNTDLEYKYINGLSKAIKTSNYSVWTRVNWAYETNVAQGIIQEAQNNGSNNYFDFGGYDPYDSNPDDIYNIASDPTVWHYGKNLSMIMENAGNYTNTDKLMFNAFAADGHYHIFEYNDSWSPNPQGLYSTNFTAKTISPKSHVQTVRTMIALLKDDWYDLATKQGSTGGSNAVFFNRDFSSSANQSSIVGTNPIGYSTSNSGAGVAVARNSNTYVFMSTAPASFTLPPYITITSLQTGYYDSNNNWFDQGNLSYTGHAFSIGAYQCVQMSYSGGLVSSQIVRIKNRNLGTYLYEDSNEVKYGNLAATDTRSQWILEQYNGYTKIENAATGDFMNNKDGYDWVESTVLGNPGWWSSEWTIAPSADGQGYQQIQNRNTSGYINVEGQKGYAQCTALGNPGWWSSDWTLETVSTGPVVRVMNRNLGTYLYESSNEVHYANPPSTDPHSQWVMENYAGYTKLRNVATGDYMNNQDGYDWVESTILGNPGWWSAQWTVSTDAQGYLQIQNHNTSGYINTEGQKGYAQCTALGNPGWWSAEWVFQQ